MAENKENLIRNEREAIECITKNRPSSGYDMLKEALDMAVVALEKQTPKKLIEHHYEDVGEEPYIKYGCPNGCKIQPSRRSQYCSLCGQKLLWDDDEK